MDAPSALALLRSRGLSARTVGGRLKVGPAELLDDDLRGLIRSNARELTALLDPIAPDFDVIPFGSEPPGTLLGLKTVSAADYLRCVAEGAEHNAAIMKRSLP